MVTTVSTAFHPHLIAGGAGKFAQNLRCDRFLADGFEHGYRPVSIDASLIAGRFEGRYATFQFGIVKIGNAAFDGIIEPLEA